MFEWCFRARYRTAIFGITVVGSVASFAGQLGAGAFSVVFGITAGMPVLVAGSPPLDGERYLDTTTSRRRALDAGLTAVGSLLAGLLVAVPAAALLGSPVPALLGAVAAVLGGQITFSVRNREYVDSS